MLRSFLLKLRVAAIAAAVSFILLAFVVPFLAELAAKIVGGILHAYVVAGVASIAIGVFAFLNASKAEALVRLVSDEVKKI